MEISTTKFKRKFALQKSLFSPTDNCIAFDGKAWDKAGDIGDNSCFYKKAIVLGVRRSKDGEWLADIMFEDGKESKGHFQGCLKKC